MGVKTTQVHGLYGQLKVVLDGLETLLAEEDETSPRWEDKYIELDEAACATADAMTRLDYWLMIHKEEKNDE